MDLNQDYTSYVTGSWINALGRISASHRHLDALIEQNRLQVAGLGSETEGFRSATEEQKQKGRELQGQIQVLEQMKAGTHQGSRHPGHSATPGIGRGRITRDTVTLGKHESVAEWARVHGQGGDQRPGEELSLGKWLRGQITGEWEGAGLERQASLGEGSVGTGGAFVPSPLSSMIIDLARTKARVIQAGATTVPMTSSTLAIGRVASDPGSAWKSESAAVASPTDPTYERVTFTARTLVGFVKASRELWEDAANMDQIVTGQFAETLARKLDLAALYGSGTAPEPRGVKNTAGINSLSMGTNGVALTDYGPFVDQAQKLWEANFDSPTAYIMAPRTRGNVGRLKDTTGQPMRAPSEVDQIPRLETTQVPVNLTQGTSNLASDIFGADWSQLLIGMRTGIQIEILRERFAADTFEVGILAHMRADIQVAHPLGFVVTVGVL